MYRAARVTNFEGILGFSVPSNILLKGGNASHNATCSPSLAENDSRLFKNSKEIAMVSGFLSKEGGRRCFIRANDKNKKEQKNLRSNLI